jgi:hypothetical protein
VPNGLVINEECRDSCFYRGIRHANIRSFLTTEARIISKVEWICVCVCVRARARVFACVCVCFFLCGAQSGNIGIHLPNIMTSLTHTPLSSGVIFRPFQPGALSDRLSKSTTQLFTYFHLRCPNCAVSMERVSFAADLLTE